ncbi:snaclec coagulation factor IX/factor X-binding protein subunit A-like [Pholidichthys leucotaenia]
MTWEEALHHCEQTNSTLISLPSENENLLARKQFWNENLSQWVWIGLRYLGDRWLWMDGSRVEYEAWLRGPVQDLQCPILNRCGALTKVGEWKSLDCEMRLFFICS